MINLTENNPPFTQKASTALRPVMSPILHISTETPRIKVFTLFAPTIAQVAVPGQFIMVWIPGIDEIPMSISSTNESTGYVEFAAAKVGDATKGLHTKRKGDILGIRGPLGQGFKFPKRTKAPLLLVAGGCGAPPLAFAAQCANQSGFDLKVVLGAASKTELLFLRRFEQLANKVLISTDDGSMGIKGTAVDVTARLLETNSTYAASFACGPEGMLHNLSLLFEKYPIPLQVSLERYMKCGVGLCGHCVIDIKGTRVCHEGPVFNAKDLKDTDFGKWMRDSTGKRQPYSTDNTSCAT